MKMLYSKVKFSQVIRGVFLSLLIIGSANTSLAVGPSYPVQGQVNLDGLPANGAIVTISDANTGATTTATVGPVGGLGVSGWYNANLNNFTILPQNGDVINISATKGGVTGTSSFIYNSLVGSKLANTINLVTPAPTNFTIVSTANANGTISPLGTSTVASGTAQTFSIIPNSGFDVSDILIDNVSVATTTGTTTSYTFPNVLGNHTIEASFASGTTPSFTITSSTSTPNGTISPLGTSTFTVGSSTNYTITPDSGFQVADVLIDNVSVGATSSFAFNNIATNHTISVSFRAASVLATINIAPVDLSTIIGSVLQYSASALDQFGNILSAALNWSSSDPTVAIIDSSGQVTTLSTGTTTIMASSTGITGSTTLTVTSSSTPSTSTPTTITLTPASSTIFVGEFLQFSASTSDQFGQPVIGSTTWSVNNSAVGTIGTSSGIFTAVASGTAIITASSGNLSATSTVTVLTDTTPPTTPTNLTLSGVSGSQISLNWSSSTDNARVAGYNVYRNGTSTPIATTTQNSYTDTGLAATTTYSYTVSAFDPSGNVSGLSTTTSTTTGLASFLNSLSLPASSTVYIGGTLQFLASTSDQYGLPFNASTTWSIDNPSIGSIGTSSGLFTALATGTAVVTASSSNLTATSTVTVLLDTTAPTTPTNLIATPISSSQINLSWSSSTDNARVAGYNVYRNGTSTLIATTSQNSYSDTGLSAATTYSYVVRAFDPSGNVSAFSTSTSASTSAASTGGGGGGGGSVGGGGGTYTPDRKDSTDAPLELSSTQEGHATFNFDDNHQLKIDVPKEAVSTTTKFTAQSQKITTQQIKDLLPANATVIGDTLYQINATDLQGQAVKKFDKDITITIIMTIPTDTVNLGVYYYDENSRLWIYVPGVVFDANNRLITIKTNHLTTYGVFRAAGLPSTLKPTADTREVLGNKTYADGTLIKANNGRIYFIKNGRRIHILNLKELLQYRGKQIIKVDDQVLNNIPEVKRFADNILIKGADNKIYVIKNQKAIHIINLAELSKYLNKSIIIVDSGTLNAYKEGILIAIEGTGKFADNTLIKGTDNKIYIIKNQKKIHIINLTELRKYRGKPIIKVDAKTFNSY